MQRRANIFALMSFVAFSILLTWPLLALWAPSLPASDDAYFSTWRIGWIAHQLRADPAHLFDGNIFYPATNTLALSDAMLLVGIIGAPLIWLGVTASLAHNLLLLAAFVTSAAAMYFLALELTGSRPAAYVSAIIFAFAPFRFAHIGHLELQWVAWMPLSVLVLLRLFEHPSKGTALLFGSCVLAQTLSSIYFGVFLSAYLLIAFVVLACVHRSVVPAALLPAAVLPMLIVVAIYGPPYSQTRTEFGSRDASELAMFSATPADYLRVPGENWLRGARGHGSEPGVAPDERSLYPGAIASLLALFALIPPVPRRAWVFLLGGLASFDLSLGTNGLLFPLLTSVAPWLTSLRSPSRFGILVLMSIAGLAAIGLARIIKWRPAAGNRLAATLVLLSILEYWSAPITARAYTDRPSEAHRWLAQQPAGSVTIEMPVPRPDALWLYETTYELKSVHHWQPLVNGYSGHAPRAYRQTLEQLRSFPDDQSLQYLERLGVKFILLNRAYYGEFEFQELVGKISSSALVCPPREIGVGDEAAVVVEFKRRADGDRPPSAMQR